jgi:succinyl-diaminopimelate desuccinylase
MEDTFRKLISIPSVCGDLAVAREIIDVATKYLEPTGMHIQHFEENGFPSLVATTRQTKTPRLMLGAHLDVVSAPSKLFALRKSKGVYIGRGTFDMKFAAASYITLMQELQPRLSDYDIGIMFTTDEENHGQYGTGMLVERGYVPKVCVLPDGGQDWQIETFAKGRWFAQVTIKGKSAHGSRPWEGDSASIKLVQLLGALSAAFEFTQMPDTETLNIGMMNSGLSVNQIPDSATASIDIRYMDIKTLHRIKKKLEDLCKKFGANLTPLNDEGHPVINRLDNPHIATFAACVEKVVGIVPTATVSFGTSDGRFFTPLNVPCIITRPAGGGQHSDKEWLDIDGFFQFHEVLREYVNEISRLSTQTLEVT